MCLCVCGMLIFTTSNFDSNNFFFLQSLQLPHFLFLPFQARLPSFTSPSKQAKRISIVPSNMHRCSNIAKTVNDFSKTKNIWNATSYKYIYILACSMWVDVLCYVCICGFPPTNLEMLLKTVRSVNKSHVSQRINEINMLDFSLFMSQ